MSDKLKAARTAAGMTQKQLAAASGISLRTLQHYEQGSKDISQAAAVTVYRLAQALGVSMEQLLNLE